MGYYVRVLAQHEELVPLPELQKHLDDCRLDAYIRLEEGEPENWIRLILEHPNGSMIAAIERNKVSKGELGEEEIEEFLEEIEECKPRTSVEWLKTYLPKVRYVYAFQVLDGTYKDDGWDKLGAVEDIIWKSGPAIFQADGEGFSNEKGNHILWQFDDSVKGTRKMGLLQKGEWNHFNMELGNWLQRSAFLRGEIPAGMKLEP